MRKNGLKKLAAVVLSAAMVLSMGGMTAFAANYVVPDANNKITLTKTINAAGSTAESATLFVPNTTVTYTIKEATDADITMPVDKSNLTLSIFKGVAGGVSNTTSAEFTPVDKNNNPKYLEGGKTSSTADITLTADVFANKVPGIYRYVITEDTGSYDGLTYSGKYYLDLYVENILNSDGSDSGDRKISYVVVSGINEDGIPTKSDLAFDNTYTTNKLTVTKKITGNQADMSAKFKFTIKVTGAENEKYYVTLNGNAATPLTSGEEAEFELGHNEVVEIIGLSANDTYTVVEQKANDDGYTTTYSIDDTTVVDVDDFTINVDGVEKTVKGLNEKREGDADKAVSVENNKVTVTPTGIALTFAPYALLVALAGVFGFFFLRKKREDEV